jgi:SAM-dependent methyltransferase
MQNDSTVVSARTTCRLCGSDNLSEVSSFGSTPPANSYLAADQLSESEIFTPLVLQQCGACFLIQLRDVVNPTVLFSNYLYVSGTSPVFVAHFAEYAHTVVERLQLTKDSLVVDVGSNDGVLLSKFKDEGMSILGIDPAENLAQAATASGIPTIAAFFSPTVAEDIVAERGRASIITANNVFAHTDDIKIFVESVKTLLAPEGVFVFEVQYLKDLIEKNLFDMIYHEHLLYYHVTPLAPFFERMGMKLFDVQHVDTHGGSLRVYVGWSDSQHVLSPTVKEFMDAEVALNNQDTYQAFSARIEDNGNKLRELLSEFKTQGKRVVGYGAPAKATTLCYALGIDETMLDYIMDDSPLKQGRFMPGTHIAIKSSQMLYEDKPDCCLILAWNFADSIVQKHVAYKEAGGIFIVPVPDPHILP